MSFSQVQLLGNVGRTPEMSYTQDGVAVTKFSLAVSRKRGDKEETAWYNCTAWRGLAETINSHVEKGAMLFVQGDLGARLYTTRDGKSGMSLDVTVDKFAFAGNKKAEPATETGVHDLEELDESPF